MQLYFKGQTNITVKWKQIIQIKIEKDDNIQPFLELAFALL